MDRFHRKWLRLTDNIVISLDVPNLGLEGARAATQKKIEDVEFTPKDDSLGEPKEGEHDNKEHHGGNKWAGGVSLSQLMFS